MLISLSLSQLVAPGIFCLYAKTFSTLSVHLSPTSPVLLEINKLFPFSWKINTLYKPHGQRGPSALSYKYSVSTFHRGLVLCVRMFSRVYVKTLASVALFFYQTHILRGIAGLRASTVRKQLQNDGVTSPFRGWSAMPSSWIQKLDNAPGGT